MNILMLSPLPLFPTNAGDRVRIYQIALGLSHFASVTLALPIEQKKWTHTLTENIRGKFSLQNAKGNLTIVPTCFPTPSLPNKIRSLFSPLPFHVTLRYHHYTARIVEELLATQTFNVIYAHLLQTLPYVAKSHLPVLLDQQNVDRIYWQRQVEFYKGMFGKSWLSRHNLHKTVRFEQQMLSHVDTIVSVSEQDRIATRQYAAPIVSNFLKAPNGVDIGQYHYRHPYPTEYLTLKKITLGFLGSMELLSNQEAALTLLQDIYPTVQQQLPDWEISVLIIGRQPPPWLTNWGKQKNDQKITVTGDVPDILPYLHQVDLLVLPLQSGAGTKLRVLEAMAAGVGIVGTPVAIEGLDKITVGQHALLAHNVHDFTETICHLACDKTKLPVMVQQARQLIEKHYSWQKITQDLGHEIHNIYGRQ